MNDIVSTLRIAEKLLRSNRYSAEADMCKAAAVKAAKQRLVLRAIQKFAEDNNMQKHDGFDKIVDFAKAALK
jgi:hypothetical protein